MANTKIDERIIKQIDDHANEVDEISGIVATLVELVDYIREYRGAGDGEPSELWADKIFTVVNEERLLRGIRHLSAASSRKAFSMYMEIKRSNKAA